MENRMAKQTKPEMNAAKHAAGKKVETPTLNLDLLNNAIDFIQSGVRYFLHDKPDPTIHKYAILHLFTGFVLLLKERLRREHRSLIFKDVRDVSKPNGKTVDFDEAVSRLESCAGVILSQKTLGVLRMAQGLRNKAEHYECVIELKHAQAVIGDLSDAVYHFMRDELDVSLRHKVKPEIWERMQYLKGISESLEKSRIEDWKQRADKYSGLDDEELQVLADSIESYHPKHNPDPDTFLECPECGEETVVQTKDGDIGVCTNPECRNPCEITSCLRCSERLTDGSDLCQGCSDYIDRQ
jgi:PAS domain-containing protein